MNRIVFLIRDRVAEIPAKVPQ